MQKIICKKGRCIEANSIRNRVGTMYDNKNIVERIERDLYLEMV